MSQTAGKTARNRYSVVSNHISGFTGPIVELPMDEGVGTVAGDVSGQGNDGALVNGATFEANTGDGSAFAVRFDG